MKKLREQRKVFVPFKKNVRKKTQEGDLGKGKNLTVGGDSKSGLAVGGEQLLNIIIDSCDKLVAVGYYDVYTHTKEEILEHLDDKLDAGSSDEEQLGFMENFGANKKLKGQEEVRVNQKRLVIEEKPDVPLSFDAPVILEKPKVLPKKVVFAEDKKSLDDEIGKIDVGLMEKLGLDLFAGEDLDLGGEETVIYAENPEAARAVEKIAQNSKPDSDSDSDTDIFG